MIPALTLLEDLLTLAQHNDGQLPPLFDAPQGIRGKRAGSQIHPARSGLKVQEQALTRRARGTSTRTRGA